jgi:hypothetical protein
VLNLDLHNKALLIKQLHKFYIKEDIPWVKLVWSLYENGVPHAQPKKGSFWWRDIFSLVESYRSVTHCSVGSGTSVLFWKDFWCENELLCDKFPRLYSYALDEDLSVCDVVTSTDFSTSFALPLSVEAYEEFLQVTQVVQDITLDATVVDQRTFTWGTSIYTAAKYYNFVFSHLPNNLALDAIWKSQALPKLRVFAWLLMHDRQNTKELMMRKNWALESGPSCVMCGDDMTESRDHLFFDCSFALRCWSALGIHWDTSQPITERFIRAKQSFTGPCFMEVLVCSAWNIWKERNELIFQGQPISFGRWRVRFQSDLLLHRYRVKSAFVQPLVDWLLNIFV